MLNLIVRELRGQGTAEMRPCGIDPSGSQLSAGDGSLGLRVLTVVFLSVPYW